MFPLTSYSVAVTGLIDNPKMLFIKDIRSLPKYNVTATLQVSIIYSILSNTSGPFLSFLVFIETTQCAGNRRTAMSKVRNVRGVGWDVSAIGNGSFFFFLSFFPQRLSCFYNII